MNDMIIVVPVYFLVEHLYVCSTMT